MIRQLLMTSCTALLLSVTASVFAAHEIVILPETLKLSGTEARQPLLVQQVSEGTLIGQLHDNLTWTSSDPQVVRVENSVAIPVGNGKATLSVHVNGMKRSVPVEVVRMEEPHVWNFRNQVQSVFSKTGCNSGACHGAAAGKNGFKMSLRGYNPQMDFQNITRDARGRRIVPSDPGRSLLLTKPTGTIPHKGGVRFKVNSREYRVIAEWIAAGSPGPSEADPELQKLEILPSQAVLKPGDKQQLLVLAHFSDGTVEDVTSWAKYTSTNSSVAKVDELGRVDVAGYGEGSIVAWYLSNNVVATITVPYQTPLEPQIFVDAPRANFIDDLVLQKLRHLNIPPSPLCSDEEFLRRVYLDTIGILPTPEETKAFLANTHPDKRNQMIEELLARPEFVDYWSHRWSDLLLLNGSRYRPKALETYYQWIRAQVQENTPWDEFVTKIVTANGSTHENGAANFYALHQDPLTMAENVSMAFLGMSINCARCHDHPLERWTNDDYYGMANLFSRVRGKGWGGDFRSGDGNQVIFFSPEGELIQPRTGQPQQPRPLQGEPIAFDDSKDRRLYLAEWLTSPENPYFSRAITNRIWANFLGVGIVENVDDLRLTNPPSNAELLDALAEYLVKNNYDTKALMKLILQSNTYQRSSVAVEGNKDDERFYSRYYPKRLKAEVLLDAISQVTAAPTKFGDKPDGTRAIQLPDVTIGSYFLETFGRPDRLITCECERSNEPSMTQVLHLVNGKTLNEKLSIEKNRIATALAEDKTNEQIIEDLYLAAFSRFPREQEKTEILAVFQTTEPDERRTVIEDLYWSLLTSREFLFNH